MKYFTLLFCLCCFFSCQNESQVDTPTSGENKKCDFSKDALRDGQFTLRDLQRAVVLATDAKNAQGVLRVYDTENCAQVNEVAFPAFGDSTATYRMAQIIYNNQSKLVAVYGGGRIYLYDAAEDKAAGPLLPEYLTPRPRTVTGEIVRLEVWEDYLVGFAAEKGAFVFNLKEENKPAVVLPAAEFARPDGTFSSLFLLPTRGEENSVQAIFPRYDAETETFGIVSLFKKPRSLTLPEGTLKISETVVLQEGDEEYTVDMNTQSLVTD